MVLKGPGGKLPKTRGLWTSRQPPAPAQATHMPGCRRSGTPAPEDTAGSSSTRARATARPAAPASGRKGIVPAAPRRVPPTVPRSQAAQAGARSRLLHVQHDLGNSAGAATGAAPGPAEREIAAGGQGPGFEPAPEDNAESCAPECVQPDTRPGAGSPVHAEPCKGEAHLRHAPCSDPSPDSTHRRDRPDPSYPGLAPPPARPRARTPAHSPSPPRRSAPWPAAPPTTRLGPRPQPLLLT